MQQLFCSRLKTLLPRRAVVVILLLSSQASAQLPADAGDTAFFESRIRPVLAERCYECHCVRTGNVESGLALDTAVGLRTGGDRGAAIIPGDPQRSLLFQAITHAEVGLEMPPDGERLSDNQVADFRRWIEQGAFVPLTDASATMRGAETATAASRPHWAYEPIGRHEPPEVQRSDWPACDIDRFVLARLESEKLQPAPPASPSTFLRRIYFDLIGVPPAPDAIDAFEEQAKRQGHHRATAEVADLLLASESFGERWGRHWLDVARYAESSGNEANISFPYAWRYRDYVIDCFNADLPLDRFITEQVAGDLLPAEDEHERARLLIATGFLAIGPKNLDEANPAQFTADLVDEQINAVSRAFLASSLACARCHDHKTDPFSMEDYYAIAGLFGSSQTFFGTAVSPANRVASDPLILPPAANSPILHRSIGPKKAAELRDRLAALGRERETLIATGKLTLRDALRIIWQSGGLEGKLEAVDAYGQALPLAMGVLDRGSPEDSHLLLRGDINRIGKLVARGLPTLSATGEKTRIPLDTSGRLQLASWLTAPDNPLTARVLANRLWHHLLGAGLVDTMDEFGHSGHQPSHPDLLDFLALQLRENGWSVKQFVRSVVLSETYRQSSQWRADAFERDPDNRLLWRMKPRRLEAEAIRDAMLQVSGQLQTQRPIGSLVGSVIGDRPISLIGLNKKLPYDLDGSLHRSVYLPVLRDRLPDVFDVFDFAEPSLVSGAREITNVPTQSLYLLNSEFVRARAEALAERLRVHHDSAKAQVIFAFRLCYARLPTPEETAKCCQFIAGQPEERLIDFCQALFTAAEFRLLR